MRTFFRPAEVLAHTSWIGGLSVRSAGRKTSDLTWARNAAGMTSGRSDEEVITDLLGRLDPSGQAALELAPRGWTPSMSIQVALYDHALTERDRTNSYEVADELLVHGWSKPGVLDPYMLRLGGIAAWDPTLSDVFRRRVMDDESLAGMPEGLRAISKLFSRTRPTSASRGELSRHTILHGRELAYDSAKNSTQAFVLLLGVIEWAQKRKNAEWEEAHR